MMEDKTGWEIIFDGTDRGLWGRELLPAREQRANEVWTTPTRRKYTRSGKYARVVLSYRGGRTLERQNNDESA